MTQALLPGSIAINGGNNSLVPDVTLTDQRGPGFERIVNGTVDLGAWEVQLSGPPITIPEPSCLFGLIVLGAAGLRKWRNN